MKWVKAIVVDDHPLMAQATRQMLERMERIQVVGVAHDGQACLDLAEARQPELVILDYQLPDQSGTQIVEALKRIVPQAHVVIFTGMDIADLISPMLELRVSGIIQKETSETTLKRIIDCILDGQIVMPREVFYKMKLSADNGTAMWNLSEEEVLIMSMMVKGATYEHIADTIHVSKRSIDNYLRKIYGKMGVQNRIQAIERFVKSRFYDGQGGIA
jgi:two-component system competent response regulator ComA